MMRLTNPPTKDQPMKPRYQITASDTAGIIEWCSAEGRPMADRVARRLRKAYPTASVEVRPL